MGECPMPSRADQLRPKAAECRSLAMAIKDGAIRSELLMLAERYDRLIQQIERLYEPPEGTGKTSQI
jgi:hypothetical protein